MTNTSETKPQSDTQRSVLTLHSAKCLSCKSLVTADGVDLVENKDCHYNNDNSECPASELVLVTNFPIQTIVDRILAAEKDGDGSKVLRLYAKLQTYPAAAIQMVMTRIDFERKSKMKHPT
jgi:hypothetical protein